MNDAEYIFNETLKERKKLGYGARYRKIGSRSTKCSMPHDRMTKKEINNMNGEIYTISENETLSWAEFIELPSTLQEEYIKIQVTKHNCGQRGIASSMGTSQGTLCKYLKEKGISTTKYKKEMDETKNSPANIPSKKSKKNQTTNHVLRDITAIEGSLTFSGKPAVVLERVYRFLDDSKQYDFVIHFAEKRQIDS